MTFLAGVGVVNILADFYLCRNDFKALGDLFADNFHFFAAFGTLLLLIAEIVLDDVGLDILRELFKAAGLLSACMLLDGDFLGFALNVLYYFGFIKEQRDSVIELFRAL